VASAAPIAVSVAHSWHSVTSLAKLVPGFNQHKWKV
jgi:hypothetical protein